MMNFSRCCKNTSAVAYTINTLEKGQVESGDLYPIPYIGAMTKIVWKRAPFLQVLRLIYFKRENI